MGEIYKLEEFSLESEYKDFNHYILDKDYIILNKKALNTDYIKNNLIICLHKKLKFSKYISKINENINWLNSIDCKNNLIKYFCEFYNDYEKEEFDINKIINDKWYENLELWKASLIIDKDEKITSKFICKDDYGSINETLNFYANENDFYGMEYEYMGDGWA